MHHMIAVPHQVHHMPCAHVVLCPAQVPSTATRLKIGRFLMACSATCSCNSISTSPAQPFMLRRRGWPGVMGML
jgi:hypothetical protein